MFFTPDSVSAWEQWLAENHQASEGVWLVLYKKATGRALVYAEVLDAALCYGWIDGQRKAWNEEAFHQRFSPRSKRSLWSKINRERALELIRAGRMKPAGEAEVRRAQEDGRWERAYDGPAKATVPDDLKAAFRKHPKAKAFFATLSSQNRYAILFRLQTAKKAETRARRLTQFVEMLNEGRTIYP